MTNLTVAENPTVMIMTIKPENTLTDRQLDYKFKKLTALQEKIDSLKDALKPIESEYKTLADEVIKAIHAENESVSGETRNWTYSRKVSPVKSLDDKRLKAELPDVYQEYIKVSPRRQALKFVRKGV